MVRTACVLLSLLLLFGCEEEFTQTTVCNETPGLCNDLNTDSHCKNQRDELIMARYHEYKKSTDDNKFTLLQEFEKYDKCVALAAKIQQIKQKEITTSRVEGHLTSIKEISRIYRDSKDTNHPGLLYYQWSRNYDHSALTKFLALEDDPRVTNDPQMQLFLASYYIKHDEEKTIDLLFKSLELNKPEQIPSSEVYTTLVSLFNKHKKYKQTYIFGRVAQLSGVTNIDLMPIENQLMASGQSLDELDELAEQTYENIEEGTFVSPSSF